MPSSGVSLVAFGSVRGSGTALPAAVGLEVVSSQAASFAGSPVQITCHFLCQLLPDMG